MEQPNQSRSLISKKEVPMGRGAFRGKKFDDTRYIDCRAKEEKLTELFLNEYPVRSG